MLNLAASDARWMFRWALVLLIVSGSLGVLPSTSALAADAPRTLQVVTRAVPPFAYQNEQGKWQGIAIELWERAIADTGMRSEYRAASLKEMLDLVAEAKVDAAVGALTITAEREGRFDFSHPFFRTGLGIAVPAESMSGFDRIWRGLTSPTFLATVSSLLGLLALVGALVWLFERHRNSQFPKDAVRGIGVGMWFSSVTMTTVGYGDKAALTFGGRTIAMIWMFVSVILLSMVTATLTTSLTIDALSGKVRTEDDLRRARTGTVADTTSEARLQRKGYRHKSYPNIKVALDALAAKELDAVVYDQPLLRYFVKTDFADKLQILPISVEPQDYGIALPLGSAMRKPLNLGLMRHSQGLEWDALISRHMGETP